jgi:hypothetical protein
VPVLAPPIRSIDTAGLLWHAPRHLMTSAAMSADDPSEM